MKKIIIPTDFSTQAEYATELAVNLAKKLKADVVLVHVIEQPSSSSFSISGEALASQDWDDKLYVLKLIETGKAKLTQTVDKIRGSGLSATFHLRIGNPFHGIQSVIVDEAANLIVMGTQGHSALDELLIGSNTEKVIREAHCPVLTVKNKPSLKDWTNIVFPVSVDSDDKQTPHLIHELQKVFGATLNLVWINTPLDFLDDGRSLGELQQFADTKQFKNYSLHVYNDQSVEEGVLNYAESINADLIAMMTTKHRGLAKLFGGGIRKAVSHHTSKPMLTWLVE